MIEIKYIFTVTLVGRGSNEKEAWENAKENFHEDPVSCDNCIKEISVGSAENEKAKARQMKLF